MPGAFFRRVQPESVRAFHRTVRSRISDWTLYAFNAQPWGGRTPMH